MAKTILEYDDGTKREFDSPLSAFAYEQASLMLQEEGVFSEDAISKCAATMAEYLEHNENAINYDALSQIVRESGAEPENVLEKIENLMGRGYSEEHAEKVAAYSDYNVPLEDLMD